MKVYIIVGNYDLGRFGIFESREDAEKSLISANEYLKTIGDDLVAEIEEDYLLISGVQLNYF